MGKRCCEVNPTSGGFNHVRPMAALTLPLLRFARFWSVFLRVVVYSGASHGAVYYKRQGRCQTLFWGICFKYIYIYNYIYIYRLRVIWF